MKNYIKPQTEVFKVNPQSLLVSSIDMKYRCDNSCRLWHTCKDRRMFKTCPDKYCRIWHTCLDRQNGKTCYDKR